MRRRRGFLMAVIFVFVFVVVIMMSNISFYAFEHNYNSKINNINDGFKAVESVFQLSGGQGVYPVTIGGRITSLVTLLMSIVLLILFASQVFKVVTSFNLKDHFTKIEKDIKNEEDDIMEEFAESQKLEADILKKQDEILHYEENIMRKLDKLREDKQKN